MNVMRTLPRLLSDTGQKKTPEKKDGRRMSFQRPKGTIEYAVSNAAQTNRPWVCFGTVFLVVVVVVVVLLLLFFRCPFLRSPCLF